MLNCVRKFEEHVSISEHIFVAEISVQDGPIDSGAMTTDDNDHGQLGT